VIVAPYVAPPEFIAYPNYLDLDDLVPGGDATAQTAELVNTLRRVSALADAYCRRKLRAQVVTETFPARAANSYGFTIKGTPFISWSSITYTVPECALTSPTTVDVTSLYQDEDGVWHIPSWALPAGWGRVQLTVSYVAGFPVTALSSGVAAGAQSIPVVDPAGIMPGLEMRFPDPKIEEDITVGAEYIAGSTVVPLASPLLNAHASGVAVDALPLDVHEAVILWTMGLLARPANGGEMDPFSDTNGEGPTTQGKDPRRTGTGLIAGAKKILDRSGLVRAR
jgi:hypothetical protein